MKKICRLQCGAYFRDCNLNMMWLFLLAVTLLPYISSYQRMPITPSYLLRVSATEKEYYNDHFNDKDLDRVGTGLKQYREYAKSGLNKIINDNDIEGAIADFKIALSKNSSQPLQQLGILYYCIGRYQEAEQQLLSDITIMEQSKLFKASDLRLWRSAALNKLNKTREAYLALDHTYLSGIPESRPIMNMTLNFFAQKHSLEYVMDIVNNMNQQDFSGVRFFTNFYIGLYYDSVNNEELATAFLSIIQQSNKFPPKDMWYHVPRILYQHRGYK